MLNANRKPHGLVISLRGILVHGVITLLAVTINSGSFPAADALAA